MGSARGYTARDRRHDIRQRRGVHTTTLVAKVWRNLQTMPQICNEACDFRCDQLWCGAQHVSITLRVQGGPDGVFAEHINFKLINMIIILFHRMRKSITIDKCVLFFIADIWEREN